MDANDAKTSLAFRVPWWIQGELSCLVDGRKLNDKQGNGSSDIWQEEKDGYLTLHGSWTKNRIKIILPRGLHTWQLPDEPDTVAFLDGPAVLAGIIPQERILYGDVSHPETFIKPHNERVWGSWTNTYKTFGQQNGFYFRPLWEIGDETYTVYFPVRSNMPSD